MAYHFSFFDTVRETVQTLALQKDGREYGSLNSTNLSRSCIIKAHVVFLACVVLQWSQKVPVPDERVVEVAVFSQYSNIYGRGTQMALGIVGCP